MVQNLIISFVLLIISGFASLVFGQTPDALKPSVISGEVISIDASTLVIKTADGNVTASLTDKTEFKRVPPGNPSLRSAEPSAASDIDEGDKVVVTGVLNADKRSLPARAVYLMTKSDLAMRNRKEAEEWRLRGISGRVTAVDVALNKITISVAGMAGTTSVDVTPKPGSKFHRYAPDSVKFSEALPSSISEVKKDDLIRAKGDRSPDGATFLAEELVAGAFMTIAGTVKSVDTEKNEVIIKDLNSGKDITILTAGAMTFKRFPEADAERMASFQFGGMSGGARPPGAAPQGGQAGGVRPAGGPPQAGGQPTAGAPSGSPQQGGFGGMRPGGGNIDDMLERFPTITTADLKVGDMIAVSSSRGSTPDRVRAIKLLAGVEPFLRLAQMQAARQGGQGVSGGFSIPGLDGIGF